jgi:hypothetical protein
LKITHLKKCNFVGEIDKEIVGGLKFEYLVIFLCICAQELDLPILKVAAPEIVSGVSGESEQKLRDLFEQAVVSQLMTLKFLL